MKGLVIFLVCWSIAVTGVAVFQGFFIHCPKFREWLKNFFFNEDEDNQNRC